MTAEGKPRIRGGEAYVTTAPLRISALTHWLAPFTSGFECELPEGTPLVAADDLPDGATLVGFRPVDYEGMELLLVPAEDRLAEKYGGYTLLIDLTEIGRTVIRVAE